MNRTGFWASRTPRERMLILLGVVVLAVAAYLLATPPEGSQRGMLPASVAKQRYEEALKKKAEADKTIQLLTPKLDTAAYKETSEKVVPTVLKTLREHASKAGVHLREVKPLRPRQVGGATKVSLTVRFSGSFREVVPFLYYVEDPQGKLVVEKLNVSAPDPKKSQVDVEVQVAFFTVEKRPAEGGSAS